MLTGDLGHVTSVVDPKVEEGDSRYLPTEVLHEDFSALPKVDIFALGLTLYECASLETMPKNGPVWVKMRNDGCLPEVPGYSKCLQDLMKQMIHPDPKMRPSANQLINHEIFNVSTNNRTAIKSRGQLRRELADERQKNIFLEKQLEQARYFLQQLSPATPSCFTVNNHENQDGDGSFITPSTTPAPSSEELSVICESPVPNLMEADNASSDPASSLASGAFKLSLASPNSVSDNNVSAGTSAKNGQAGSVSSSSSSNSHQQIRSYHYNTRSQQQAQNQQTKPKTSTSQNRLIGKRSNRSHSLV